MNLKRFLKPHTNVLVSLKIILLMMVIFTLIRLFFIFTYYKYFAGIEFSEIVLSLIIGLRFDLSATMMIGGLFFILLNLPGNFKFKNVYFSFVLFLFFIIFITAITISIGDIYYYQFTKRRISYEIFNLTKSTSELLNIIFKDYLIQLIAFILFIFLGGYFFIKIFIKKNQNTTTTLSNDILYLIIVIIGIIISIRGGLQLKPLRESYAFRNERVILGHLSLNAVFTSLRTLYRGDIKWNNFLSYNEVKKNVKILLSNDKEIYLNEDYPVMRRYNISKNEINKLNIVIFVMESWSSKYLHDTNLIDSPTPFLNRLINDSYYCSNFFATGQRTIQGMQAIIGSIPNVVYDNILGSPIEQNNLRPLHLLIFFVTILTNKRPF